MTTSPTPAFTGSQLGPPLLVLTRPEIRSAEELGVPQRFDTRDGIVHGRKGDFAVTAYGGERYPILADVYYGTYEVLGKVGTDVVGQRLIHVRRAWEVLDDGATFDYGPGRGKVPVERGSWLYQSDEKDFGTIHPQVKLRGHMEVGRQDEIMTAGWRKRLELWTYLVGVLPPLLTALALGAFAAMLIPGTPRWIADVLIFSEVVLLLIGGMIVFVMKRQRWFIKACVEAALNLGKEFQVAAQLLGEKKSTQFPGMALWRAAQMPSKPPTYNNEQEQLKDLNSVTALTLRRIENAIFVSRRQARLASWISFAAFLTVLCGNLYLLFAQKPWFVLEFVVIWLPVLVAALHGVDLYRRTAERVAAMRFFSDQIRFARTRLFEVEDSLNPRREAALKLICRAAAQYTQHELRIALSIEPEIPV